MILKPVGFVIANDDKEFLSDFRVVSGVVVCCWVSDVVFSKLFRFKKDAFDLFCKIDDLGLFRSWVLEVLDQDGFIVIGTEEEDYPAWLTGKSENIIRK